MKLYARCGGEGRGLTTHVFFYACGQGKTLEDIINCEVTSLSIVSSTVNFNESNFDQDVNRKYSVSGDRNNEKAGGRLWLRKSIEI